ncbi:Hypothetical protein PHPALM_36790 [Phytophthora palmivora]|uniref:Uncharacterized protein n=1 Tax=Phytophthora palmivora TaxID=4796 RepID=A0A2P4WZ22_9STRA|nr:Hypothetical protein PHPALM_36790 [Phytophthora palmivora]
MECYSIGTVRTDRLGLPVSLVGEKQNETAQEAPVNIERGTFKIAELAQISCFRALRWWNNTAVYMLASGGSVQFDRVVRRDKRTGEQAEIACPRVWKKTKP